MSRNNVPRVKYIYKKIFKYIPRAPLKSLPIFKIHIAFAHLKISELPSFSFIVPHLLHVFDV